LSVLAKYLATKDFVYHEHSQHKLLNHCNQLTSNHPSNAATVFVRFVSRVICIT
jgi:hypothetical protein